MSSAPTEIVISPVDMPESEQGEILELYRTAVLAGSRAKLVSPTGQLLDIPASVYPLLVAVLKNLAEGASVAVFQEKQGLTTAQASRALGMSRQFFVNLLEAGALPFTKIGTHRRIDLKDLLAYKAARDKSRRAILDQMLRSEVEAGAGDASLDDYAGQ